jgi:hypothetical protein
MQPHRKHDLRSTKGQGHLVEREVHERVIAIFGNERLITRADDAHVRHENPSPCWRRDERAAGLQLDLRVVLVAVHRADQAYASQRRSGAHAARWRRLRHAQQGRRHRPMRAAYLMPGPSQGGVRPIRTSACGKQVRVCSTAAGVADDDEWAPIERPDEIAMAEVNKAKSKKLSKVDKVWPAQGVKIESVVNCATVHKGMKSTSRPSSHPSTSTVRGADRREEVVADGVTPSSRPSTSTGSAVSNPHIADRRVEAVAAGVADDDVWAPTERPDKIATAEVDKAKSKNMSKDVSLALRRGTIAQVITLALNGRARPARRREQTRLQRGGSGLVKSL